MKTLSLPTDQMKEAYDVVIVGVNPLNAISTLAERNVDLLIRDHGIERKRGTGTQEGNV